MRILFVALSLPFPPTSGHRVRTWSLLKALAHDGHDLTLVSFVERGEEVAAGALREVCRDIEMLPPPRPNGTGWREYGGRARALLSPLPYGVWRFRSPALKAWIAAALRGRGFDAIVCDGVYNVVNLPDPIGVPVLLNKDDVAHVILRRYLALERNPVRRAYAWIEATKVEAWERWACGEVSAVLASSELDAAALRSLCPWATIAVVPNIVDTDTYVPCGDGDGTLVLYQGGLDWYPNRDAVQFFAAEILPELRNLAPEARFRVAGRCPEGGFRRRMEREGQVEFSGTVPDMRAEISRATVCVVPLRIGSGTRLKILEAAAMGKPIVSTRLGAEALPFRDGEEILLADEPKMFARLVADLLRDRARRNALGRAARRMVVSQNSVAVMTAALTVPLEAIGQ